MPIDAPIHVNEANLPRVLGAGLPVLLVFWRRECPPCDQLAPSLERLAKSTAGRALIAKINVADEPRLAQRYGVDRLPTLIFTQGGSRSRQSARRGPGSRSGRVARIPDRGQEHSTADADRPQHAAARIDLSAAAAIRGKPALQRRGRGWGCDLRRIGQPVPPQHRDRR